MSAKQKTRRQIISRNKYEKLMRNKIDLESENYSILNNNHAYIVDGIIGAWKTIVYRVHKHSMYQLFFGFICGLIITSTFIFSIYIMSNLDNDSLFGIKLLLFSLIMPISFVMVSFIGMTLFTNFFVASLVQIKGSVSFYDYIKSIVWSFFGNILGIIAIIAIEFFSGVFKNQEIATIINELLFKSFSSIGSYILEYVNNLMANKMNSSIAPPIAFAISFSNILITIITILAISIVTGILIFLSHVFEKMSKNKVTIRVTLIFFTMSLICGALLNHAILSIIYLLSEICIYMSETQIHVYAIKNYMDSGNTIIIEKNSFLGEITIEFSFLYLYALFVIIPTIVGNFLGAGLFAPLIFWFSFKKYLSLLAKLFSLYNINEKLKKYIKPIPYKEINYRPNIYNPLEDKKNYVQKQVAKPPKFPWQV
ncbi:formate/nitrite transporter family protein [Spiroplasma endosymbiont of Labia minor]|uniref:formate/nitrite transporter family protein n=1 Tax=Spiroplasma endosymbiont of Labia minor TaxID=3066305 RepID=UPI0030CBCA75